MTIPHEAGEHEMILGTRRSSRRMVLGVVAMTLGVALLAAAIVAGSRREPPPAQTAAMLDAVTSAPRQPARARRRAARPVGIEIPAIGVRAKVVRLGLNADRTLAVPFDFAVTGWWAGGSRPGNPGPAVIVGHVDSQTGPAVFYRLGDLRPGDAIAVVAADGERRRFVVERSALYLKADFPTARVYGPTRGATLRLVTCGGEFDRGSGHYLSNTVVFARAA